MFPWQPVEIDVTCYYHGTEQMACPEVNTYELTYGTSHKGPSLVAAFSNDGKHNVWQVTFDSLIHFISASYVVSLIRSTGSDWLCRPLHQDP